MSLYLAKELRDTHFTCGDKASLPEKNAVPRGNVFMQIRDTLETIYTDEIFADLYPTHAQPACVPWRLALVTIFQFMEGLTDRQAADAVRDRLVWMDPTQCERQHQGER